MNLIGLDNSQSQSNPILFSTFSIFFFVSVFYFALFLSYSTHKNIQCMYNSLHLFHLTFSFRLIKTIITLLVLYILTLCIIYKRMPPGFSKCIRTLELSFDAALSVAQCGQVKLLVELNKQEYIVHCMQFRK